MKSPDLLLQQWQAYTERWFRKPDATDTTFAQLQQSLKKAPRRILPFRVTSCYTVQKDDALPTWEELEFLQLHIRPANQESWAQFLRIVLLRCPENKLTYLFTWLNQCYKQLGLCKQFPFREKEMKHMYRDFEQLPAYTQLWLIQRGLRNVSSYGYSDIALGWAFQYHTNINQLLFHLSLEEQRDLLRNMFRELFNPYSYYVHANVPSLEFLLGKYRSIRDLCPAGEEVSPLYLSSDILQKNAVPIWYLGQQAPELFDAEELSMLDNLVKNTAMHERCSPDLFIQKLHQ